MSLMTKYRPGVLDEIVGNEKTVKALNALFTREQSELPHSFLFTGETGCGKTTFGRIVAARLGCSRVNFREIDSADFRGIDFIREIRQQVKMMAVGGGVRVWLLDECHQLSRDAQNALLKSLEDPPAHVFFILCTTEPQKLLPTIVGRCVQFFVQSLPEEGITSLLRRVAKSEGIQVPMAVYQQIAEDSMGRPRNALTLLDSVLHLPVEQMLEAVTQEAVAQNQVVELCRVLLKGANWKTVTRILKGLRGEDPEKIRRAVRGYCSSVLEKKDDPTAYLILSCFSEPFFLNGYSAIQEACYEILHEE